MLPCRGGLRLYIEDRYGGHEGLQRVHGHQTDGHRHYREHPEFLCHQGGEEQSHATYWGLNRAQAPTGFRSIILCRWQGRGIPEGKRSIVAAQRKNICIFTVDFKKGSPLQTIQYESI